ncbi:MAG TPA: LysR family transcriptional regulator [Crenalkalicoccus sp.]|jgi:LysR family transcriptional regulator for metE and metH|nr:LysR family transcriptional regulator [Crenalkalicoccus sp.]
MKEKLFSFARNTSLRQLRALGAVARTGSVTAAAEALSVTPPAVAQQLRLLEEALGGVALIERTSAGARPTEAGREVLSALARVEGALADCAAAVDALRGMEGGRVAVGVISTAKYFAPFALAAFQRAHPKVEMRVLVGNRQETIAALESFELDLAVMGRPPDSFAVECAVIGDHPHVIIAPPDHPLHHRGTIPLRDVASETFLLREMGSGTRELMRRLFAEAALAPGRAIEIGSNETIKQAVMAGMGIALLSAHTIAAEVEDGRLVVLDVEGLPMVRQWFVVRRAEKRLLPAALALWDNLVRSGEHFLPRRRLPTPLPAAPAVLPECPGEPPRARRDPPSCPAAAPRRSPAARRR